MSQHDITMYMMVEIIDPNLIEKDYGIEYYWWYKTKTIMFWDWSPLSLRRAA